MMARDYRDTNGVRRPDLPERLERDLRRFDRRETGSGSFWRSIGVLGSVGWPIAAATVGGALVGQWLDGRFETGIRFTATLVFLGAVAGAAIVWHLIHPRSS